MARSSVCPTDQATQAYAWIAGQPAFMTVAERSAPPPEAPKPHLLDQVRAKIQTLQYSPRTEKTYVGWIRRFILFHRKKHPREMGSKEIGQFLSSLAIQRRVAPPTQNQALCALLFLYREVLGIDVPWLNDVVRARPATRLPVVLSRSEVRRLIRELEGMPRLMATLMYGSGSMAPAAGYAGR